MRGRMRRLRSSDGNFGCEVNVLLVGRGVCAWLLAMPSYTPVAYYYMQDSTTAPLTRQKVDARQLRDGGML